eukprot:jgi/Mesvir1/7889/Mv11822-RA.2
MSFGLSSLGSAPPLGGRNTASKGTSGLSLAGAPPIPGVKAPPKDSDEGKSASFDLPTPSRGGSGGFGASSSSLSSLGGGAPLGRRASVDADPLDALFDKDVSAPSPQKEKSGDDKKKADAKSKSDKSKKSKSSPKKKTAKKKDSKGGSSADAASDASDASDVSPKASRPGSSAATPKKSAKDAGDSESSDKEPPLSTHSSLKTAPPMLGTRELDAKPSESSPVAGAKSSVMDDDLMALLGSASGGGGATGRRGAGVGRRSSVPTSVTTPDFDLFAPPKRSPSLDSPSTAPAPTLGGTGAPKPAPAAPPPESAASSDTDSVDEEQEEEEVTVPTSKGPSAAAAATSQQPLRGSLRDRAAATAANTGGGGAGGGASAAGVARRPSGPAKDDWGDDNLLDMLPEGKAATPAAPTIPISAGGGDDAMSTGSATNPHLAASSDSDTSLTELMGGSYRPSFVPSRRNAPVAGAGRPNATPATAAAAATPVPSRKAMLDAERKAREEKEAKEREAAEKARKEREERERKEREQRERADQERREREDREVREREERQRREKAEAERKAKEAASALVTQRKAAPPPPPVPDEDSQSSSNEAGYSEDFEEVVEDSPRSTGHASPRGFQPSNTQAPATGLRQQYGRSPMSGATSAPPTGTNALAAPVPAAAVVSYGSGAAKGGFGGGAGGGSGGYQPSPQHAQELAALREEADRLRAELATERSKHAAEVATRERSLVTLQEQLGEQQVRHAEQLLSKTAQLTLAKDELAERLKHAQEVERGLRTELATMEEFRLRKAELEAAAAGAGAARLEELNRHAQQVEAVRAEAAAASVRHAEELRAHLDVVASMRGDAERARAAHEEEIKRLSALHASDVAVHVGQVEAAMKAAREQHMQEIEQLKRLHRSELEAKERRREEEVAAILRQHNTVEVLDQAVSRLSVSVAAVKDLEKAVMDDRAADVHQRGVAVEDKEQVLLERERALLGRERELKAMREQLEALLTSLDGSVREMQRTQVDEKVRLQKEHLRLDALQVALTSEREQSLAQLTAERRRLEEARDQRLADREAFIAECLQERRAIQEERNAAIKMRDSAMLANATAQQAMAEHEATMARERMELEADLRRLDGVRGTLERDAQALEAARVQLEAERAAVQELQAEQAAMKETRSAWDTERLQITLERKQLGEERMAASRAAESARMMNAKLAEHVRGFGRAGLGLGVDLPGGLPVGGGASGGGALAGSAGKKGAIGGGWLGAALSPSAAKEYRLLNVAVAGHKHHSSSAPPTRKASGRTHKRSPAHEGDAGGPGIAKDAKDAFRSVQRSLEKLGIARGEGRAKPSAVRTRDPSPFFFYVLYGALQYSTMITFC